MLKGIPHILSPELLKILAEMGHGDELVIADANFPAVSTAKRCVRADGHGGEQMLDAILELFPLDTFVEAPVTLMSPDPGMLPDDPPIWAAFKQMLERYQQGVKTQAVSRTQFYQRAKDAYAVVSTGERAFYACIILKKGAI